VGEEGVEGLAVTVEVEASVDDDGAKAVAQGRAVVEAEEGDDGGGVDGLGGCDGESLAAEDPEELVEDAEHGVSLW